MYIICIYFIEFVHISWIFFEVAVHGYLLFIILYF